MSFIDLKMESGWDSYMLPFQAIQEKQKIDRISSIRRSEDCAVFNSHLYFDTSVYSAGDVFTFRCNFFRFMRFL